MTRAVLFDWDGTLIDSGSLLLRCWHQVTTQVLGAPFPVTEPDRVRFLSMRGADSFPLLSDDPDVVRALEDGFTQAYLSLARRRRWRSTRGPAGCSRTSASGT